MSNIDLVITNLPEFKREIEAMGSDIRKELRKAIIEGAYAVDGEAKKSLQAGGKSGRVYEKYKPRRTHRASARGEAPSSDTGGLVSSIVVEEESGLSASVVAKKEYAARLENEMGRPFMEPAYERKKEWIFQRIASAIGKALNG